MRLFACLTPALLSLSHFSYAVTVTKNITLSDTSNTSSFVADAVEGTIYGDIQIGSPPLILSGSTITVNHGESAGLDRWAGFWLSNFNGATSYTFTNAKLVGDGNLSFIYKATGNQHNTDFNTLDGSAFTGRVMIANTGTRGVFATYSGTGLANAEIVFTANDTQNKVGKQTLTTGTGVNAHNWSIEADGKGADASIAGITSAAVTGTAKANKLVFKEAGKGTLTLTGGCTTNQTYSFNGEVGATAAYNNLVMEGGEQEFLGTSYFGSVTVKGGTLTLAGTTTIKGDVLVEGGRLAHSTETTIDADKSITLAGGRIDNLNLGLTHTLRQTAGTSGTLGDLTLSGGAVSFAGLDNASYSLSGTLNLEGITTLDLTGGTRYADGSTLFTGGFLLSRI